jgi:hypothetical protein
MEYWRKIIVLDEKSVPVPRITIIPGLAQDSKREKRIISLCFVNEGLGMTLA